MPKQSTTRIASSSGAELMQMQNDFGTVEAGKYADIIAVQGNPLSDISVLPERPASS